MSAHAVDKGKHIVTGIWLPYKSLVYCVYVICKFSCVYIRERAILFLGYTISVNEHAHIKDTQSLSYKWQHCTSRCYTVVHIDV